MEAEITMIRLVREKLYLVGYVIILYGICRLGYICFYFADAILHNEERTVIDANSISTIGKTQFHYGNIAIVIIYYLIYSIALSLLGTYVIKKGRRSKKKIG